MAPPALDHLLALCAEISAEDEHFRQRLLGWLADHPPPDEAAASNRHQLLDIRRSWQQTLAEHGWAGVSWPTEHGGLGAGPVAQFLYYEVLASSGAPEMANRPGMVLIAPTLMAHADAAVARRFLPRILDASDMWAQCFSEPDAGSDLAALRTTATADGNTLRIDGQKTWVTMGDLADVAVVMCRTGDPAERHRTLSMVVVDLHQPGVDVRPIRQSSGECEFSEIFFDGAKAPADFVIGAFNGGWAASMYLLELERGDRIFTDHSPILRRIEGLRGDLLAAEARGADPERLSDLWRAYAEVRADADVLREMNLEVAERRRRSDAIGAEASAVKAFWAELAQSVAGLRLELADLSVGIDHPDVRGYLYGRMATVYSGAIEIQRSIIAERVLGLPRTPSVRPSRRADAG